MKGLAPDYQPALLDLLLLAEVPCPPAPNP